MKNVLTLVVGLVSFTVWGWDPTSIGWEPQANGWTSSGAAREFNWEGPRTASGSVSARVMVQPGTVDDWKTAGLAWGDDRSSYWHLALVEAPASGGQKHFVELSEMAGGQWNAQAGDGSVLTDAQGDGGWTSGVWYDLKLTVEGSRVEGTVKTTDGRLVWHGVRTGGTVRAGRLGLTAGDFDARWESVSVAPGPALRDRPAPVWPSYQGSSRSFTVGQTDGVWWLTDPAGQPFWAAAVDHVNYRGHFCEALGYSPYLKYRQDAHDPEATWATRTVDRLRSWGFNTLGAGAGESVLRRGLAHARILSLGAGFAQTAALVPPVHWTGVPDVFDPRWPRWCDMRVRELAGPEAHDPWLIGWFLDNELDWWGKAPEGSMRRWALARPAGDPARLAAEATDDVGFEALVAERYFSVAVAALKKVDPDHLVLGCRFAGRAPQALWEAAGRWSDVVTVNVYPRLDPLTGDTSEVADELTRDEALCHRPLWITEWSFPALDAHDGEGLPLPSQHGAGMRVDDQTLRARCSSLFQDQLARLTFVVGSSYFMWADEPSRGIASTFPEDSNYGLVDERDAPYPTLTTAFATVNRRVAADHPSPGPMVLTPATGTWPRGESLVGTHSPGSLALWDSVRSGSQLLGRLRLVVPVEGDGRTDWQGPDRVAATELDGGWRWDVERTGVWRGVVEARSVPGSPAWKVRWSRFELVGPGTVNRLYLLPEPTGTPVPLGARVPNDWLGAPGWVVGDAVWGAVVPRRGAQAWFWNDDQGHPHGDLFWNRGDEGTWTVLTSSPKGVWRAQAASIRGALSAEN